MNNKKQTIIGNIAFVVGVSLFLFDLNFGFDMYRAGQAAVSLFSLGLFKGDYSFVKYIQLNYSSLFIPGLILLLCCACGFFSIKEKLSWKLCATALCVLIISYVLYSYKI
jgi:hypothetical protein